MKIFHKSERGQAVVLIVLAIVGALGISALAIDGGMIYAERRRAQNAADAAVLSGALHAARSGVAYNASSPGAWNTVYTQATAKAINQATTNGFTTGGNTTVVFRSPPEAPAPAQYIGNRAYYQVVITSEVEPIFSQFVFNGRLRYTVTSIAKGQVSMPLANGAAMYATSADSSYCTALWFAGGGDTHIVGGNIFSANPNNSGFGNCWSGVQGGSGSILVDSPYSIYVVGGWDTNGGAGTITTGTSPAVNVGAMVEAVPDLPEPVCPTGPVNTIPNNHSKPFVMTPGRWDNIRWGNGDGELQIQPGMYCITNGFVVHGGTLNTLGSVGEGAFFVVLSGDFSTNGNAVVNLNRPNDLPVSGMNWGGYLIFMPRTNTGQVVLGGGGNSNYSGTVYAPGPPAQQNQSKCIVNGNQGAIGLSSQMICYSIQITGNGSIYIEYDPSENGQVPPSIDLMN
jgi:hypothetical protein